MQALNVRISGVPDPVVVKVPDMGYIRGRDGKNGEDGFSPTVDVEDVEGGHEVTITDKEGTHSFLVKDGGAGTFVAVYGTTTLEELDAAFNAGKTIIAVEDIPFSLLTYYTLVKREKYMPIGGEALVNKYTFATCAIFSNNWIYVSECTADGWTQRTISVATYDFLISNFVQKYQNVENAGKVLTVGTNGEVSPEDPTGSIRKGTISLSTQWSGDGVYTQVVTVPGITITANSKVDIQPDMEAIEQFAEDGVAALYVENSSGTLTACAAGAAPSSAMTLQCTVTEVRA